MWYCCFSVLSKVFCVKLFLIFFETQHSRLASERVNFIVSSADKLEIKYL